MSDIRREMIMFSNLNCPTCASKLETAVRAMPGVASAKVVFGAGSLDVQYDAEKLTYEKIADVASRMGLSVATRVPGAPSAN